MSTNGESRMLVVLEEIRDEARQTNRRLDGTNQRIDSLIEAGGAWHRAVTERLDSMDARLAALEGLFGAIASSGQALQGITERLARLEQHVGLPR